MITWLPCPLLPSAPFHWAQVLPHWQEHVSRQYPQIGRRFQPPQQLHSPYYPLRGPYSSADPEVLEDQFREMKRTGEDRKCCQHRHVCAAQPRLLADGQQRGMCD